MIDIRSVPEDISGHVGGVEGITETVITDYSFDSQGNIVGIAKQEKHFCRVLAACPKWTMTLSVPGRGFAVSVMLEDIIELLKQAEYDPLND